MKKALLALAAVAMSVSAFAQGTIDFANRNIPGANGGASYNIPFYIQGGAATLTGAGTLPGGTTVGLFLAGAADNAAPIVSTLLRSDTPANAAFFATSSQTATIPGFAAGTTPQLVIRAWQGSSYAAAKAGGGQYLPDTTFTAQPLGGTPPGGGLPIPTPTLTGLIGPANNGFELVPEPSTIALGALGIGALLLRRRK